MPYLMLTLGSGDPGVAAGSNRAKFLTQLASPLVLPEGRHYEVALVTANLPHPGGYNSVFIKSNLVPYSNVGTGRAQLLYRVPPAADPVYYAVEPVTPIWLPLDQNEFTEISFELTYSTNLPIPAGQPAWDASTVTCLIREVGTRL